MKTIEIDGERFRLVRVYNGNNIEEYSLSPVNKEPQEAEDKEELWERFFKMYPEYKEMIQKYSDKPATPDEPEWEVELGHPEPYDRWHNYYVKVLVDLEEPQAEAIKEAIEATLDEIYDGTAGFEHLDNAITKARTLIQKGKE